MFLIKHHNTTTPHTQHNKILQCYDKDNIGEHFGGIFSAQGLDSETNAFGLSIQEDVLERLFAFTGGARL